MEEIKKIPFLEQYEIACIRPGKLPLLIRQKTGKKVFYFIALLLFITFIELGIPYIAWNYHVGGLDQFIMEEIPQFRLIKDGFEMKGTIDLALDQYTSLKVYPEKKEMTMSDVSDKYMQQILISHSNVLVINGQSVNEFRFSYLDGLVITNAALIPIVKLSLVIFAVFVFIANIVAYLLGALLYTLFCRGMVRTPEGRMVSSGEAYQISLFAMTIAALSGSINICLGSMLDWTILVIASMIVTMGFIRRAELAFLGEKMSDKKL